MDNLVYKGQNDQAITNSLLVAKKFGKEHKHVLDSIRDFIVSAEKSAQTEGQRVSRMFALAEYETPLNNGTNAVKKSPMFIMNRDGFTLLAMGFTGTKALQFKMEFLGAFNKMESLLNSDDYILMRSQQILQKRVEEAEQKVKALEADNAAKEETIELQQKELAQAAPKVQYVDTVLQSVNTYATNLIAKEMGMSAETLNKRLKEKGIQYRQSGVWVLTSKYQNKGYTKTRTHTYTRSDGSQSTAMLTVWTEQGRAFLHSLFKA